MCLTLVPFAVCSLPTYNIHANLQQLSARVRVATAVNRFHTLRGAGCGRGGLRYGSEDYWLVHGVSIQGIEKMVGWGAVDAHAGWLMEADHLPHGGCALVRVAPYPRAQPWGLRPRRHRGFACRHVCSRAGIYFALVCACAHNTVRHVHTTLSAARNAGL